MTRIFVVGCPRSGTTLCQTMLASNTTVYSFPETHFFKKIWGRMWRWKRLGVLSPRAARHTWETCRDLVDPPSRERWPAPAVPLAARHQRRFRDMVDDATQHRGCGHWVEKSPVHLHCIDDITGTIPDANFVHMVRDGRQVVASFAELCFRGPETFLRQALGGDKRLIARAADLSREEVLERVISRWTADVERTLQLADFPNHHLVRYERLTEEPEIVLRSLCAVLSIPFDEAMLSFQGMAESVVGHRREFEHMRGPYGRLRGHSLEKFRLVLNPSEQGLVENAVQKSMDRIIEHESMGASG